MTVRDDRSRSDHRALHGLVSSDDPQDLIEAARDLSISEELALRLLVRRDLPSRCLETLAKNAAAMKHRRVLAGIVSHPRTPRFVSLPIVNRLFVFELMQIALSPSVATDVKIAADNAIIGRLESVSAGERFTLSKQGSTRLAGALLNDAEDRVIEAALDNPRMTEIEIVKALKQEEVAQSLISLVCGHRKWAFRTEIQMHVLKASQTPLAKAVLMAERLPPAKVQEVLKNSRLPEQVRAYLVQMQWRRRGRSC